MATLGELIRQRKEALGLSFRQMGKRAKDAGAEVEPNWSHLANRPLREFPKARTIHALAHALDVTPEEVAHCALESLGLCAKHTDSIVRPGDRWIVISTDDLSPDDEAVIRKAINEAMTKLRTRKST
jgi:transcriptional regulator with XRE-family HTH domain